MVEDDTVHFGLPPPIDIFLYVFGIILPWTLFFFYSILAFYVEEHRFLLGSIIHVLRYGMGEGEFILAKRTLRSIEICILHLHKYYSIFIIMRKIRRFLMG